VTVSREGFTAKNNGIGWWSSGLIFRLGDKIRETEGFHRGDRIGFLLEKNVWQITFFKNGCKLGDAIFLSRGNYEIPKHRLFP